MEFEQKDLRFMGSSREEDTSKVRTPFAFLGIPYGPPYHAVDLVACAGAADAVRQMTYDMGVAFNWDHMNFDTGHAVFADGTPTVTDCGDVPSDVRNPDAIWETGIEKIRPLAQAGVVPLVVGGLDSIPPIVVGAFEGLGTRFNVLHVDAHLDFREERYGVSRGFSSPIRRIRELECVNEVVQIGLRSMGSARVSDVEEARAAGNRIVTAWELHEQGATALLESLPNDLPWLITIDCDGLDPAIAPAVGWPEPGGVDFMQIGTILGGLAERGSVAGLVFTEFQPALDVRGITAKTIARLMMKVMGTQGALRPAPRFAFETGIA